MANIVLQNLTKVYGKTYAIENLNLEINDGELFILLGPSGCGKSTTLLSIAGLIKPEEGEIKIGDTIMLSSEQKIFIRPQDRDGAMVFQDYALYPHLTVFQNIAFPLEVRKIEKDEIDRRVKKAAESIGISSLLERKPRQLSGGQRQRVALGRAIVRQPKVFLMDEPLSNLDAKLRDSARAELKKLHEKLGTTFVYVTHDQLEAMSLGDRIAILNNGTVEQVGTPDDIYRCPTNVFVATFIGTPPMNIIEGSLQEIDGNTSIQFKEFVYTFKNETAIKKATEKTEIIFGIRPENIHISKTPLASNSIEAKIYVIEPLGRENYIHLEVGKKKLVAMISSLQDLKVNDVVFITFDENHVHIFDKDTKNRINNKH